MSSGVCAESGAFEKSIALKIRIRSPPALVVTESEYAVSPPPVLPLLTSTGEAAAILSSNTIAPCASTRPLNVHVAVLGSSGWIAGQYNDCLVGDAESSRTFCQPSDPVIAT